MSKEKFKDALISWERWEPPNRPSFEEPEEENLFNEDDHDDEMNPGMMMFVDPKVFTPMGTYHTDDPLSPHNLCEECWWMHTKFPCSDAHSQAIRQVPGLELLVQVTKYRYFIGLGKMFTLKDVRQDVEDIILQTEQKMLESDLVNAQLEDFVILNEKEQEEYFKQQIDEVKAMASNYKAWAISIDHTGEIHSIMTDDPDSEEYKLEYQKLKEANGFFITSENGSLPV